MSIRSKGATKGARILKHDAESRKARMEEAEPRPVGENEVAEFKQGDQDMGGKMSRESTAKQCRKKGAWQ